MTWELCILGYNIDEDNFQAKIIFPVVSISNTYVQYIQYMKPLFDIVILFKLTE
jgi:hypothetical protein